MCCAYDTPWKIGVFRQLTCHPCGKLQGDQKTAGHVFNVDGAGADGSPTPYYAAYGATKTGGLQPLPAPKCDTSASFSCGWLEVVALITFERLLFGVEMAH